MIFFSNCFSARTFLASLIGVIAPYWFVSGYFAYTDNLQALSDHFTAIIDYQELFDYSQITLHQLINYGLSSFWVFSEPFISSIQAMPTRYAHA